MWFADDKRELLAQRIHYTALANLVPNNHFNAVKFLYDRLNIIDAKAQGLLTRNGLLLTTVSIIASTQIRPPSVFLYNAWWQTIFGVSYLLLVLSTLATLKIMLLRFDSVTVLPASADKRLQESCICSSPRPGQCQVFEICGYRQVLLDIATLKEQESQLKLSAIRSDYMIGAYEDAFFRLTITRQRALRVAQWFTIVATVSFFIVIGYIFFRAAVR